MTERKGDRVKRLILENIEDHSSDIVNFMMDLTGLKKSTLNYHIDHLVKSKKLVSFGKTKAKRYELAPINKYKFTSDTSNIDENKIYTDEFYPYFSSVKADAEYVWHHSITEMVNNVKDHSGANIIEVELLQYTNHSLVRVSDDGVGIFNKIMQDQNLDSIDDAMLQLSKGGKEITSDPDNHAGEGIYFTSRMLDMFCISSEGRLFEPKEKKFDKQIMDTLSPNGTNVLMKHWDNSSKTAEDVFRIHTELNEDDEPKFTNTTIQVVDAMLGGNNLVSRSQAKRLTVGLHKFKKVTLDFNGVEIIGQGFADETFRVFANNNPQLRIEWENASDNVEKMINHVLK